MYSDTVGLIFLGIVIFLAFYGLYKLCVDIKRFFFRRHKEKHRIIGRYDE